MADGRKPKGKHPEKRLTSAFVRKAPKPCRYYDGYGHFRVDRSENEIANGTVHINGIEGFWGLARVRLTKFKGLPRHTFQLHLKKPSGGSTTAKPTSTRTCYATSAKIRSARQDPR